MIKEKTFKDIPAHMKPLSLNVSGIIYTSVFSSNPPKRIDDDSLILLLNRILNTILVYSVI